MVSVIYKIVRTDEWRLAQQQGVYHGSADDRRDGFIHFSNASQVAGTLAKHFSGEEGLYLLAIEEHRLGDALRWESSRNGQLFPHLYRALDITDIEWAKPISNDVIAGLTP